MLINERLFEVNSYHDFCIADCQVEFDVLARAEDSTIECVTRKIILE